MTRTQKRAPPPPPPILLLPPSPLSPLDRRQDGHRKSGTNAHRPRFICFFSASYVHRLSARAALGARVCLCRVFGAARRGSRVCISLPVKHLCVGPHHGGTTDMLQIRITRSQESRNQRHMSEIRLIFVVLFRDYFTEIKKTRRPDPVPFPPATEHLPDD